MGNIADYLDPYVIQKAKEINEKLDEAWNEMDMEKARDAFREKDDFEDMHVDFFSALKKAKADISS